jgi:cell division protein FtsQ
MALMSRVPRTAQSARRSIETRKRGVGNNRYNKPAKPWRLPRPYLTWRGLLSTAGWIGALASALVLVAGISVGLLYGYRYMTISSYFAVKSIEIQGNFRLSSREVLDIAGVDEGMNSLLVSIDEMERNLTQNPWVSSVSVKRILPDGFVIALTEKQPRFWVQQGGVLYYADGSGKPIAAVSPGKFASFPSLEIESGAEDMVPRLPELIRSLSQVGLAVSMSMVSLVRLSPGRGVEVFLDNNRLVLSIGQEEWRQNLERLAATLTDLGRRGEMKKIREVRVHGASVWVITNGPVA